MVECIACTTVDVDMEFADVVGLTHSCLCKTNSDACKLHKSVSMWVAGGCTLQGIRLLVNLGASA